MSHQAAFNLIKTTIACDVVLAYPNFRMKSEIYTDASIRKLCAVIVQKSRPIAFFSRKLTGVQQEYYVTELKTPVDGRDIERVKGNDMGPKD